MRYYLIILAITLGSCNQSGENNKPPSKAQQIIDKAIENAGGEKFNKAIISFDFRGTRYISDRNNGLFTYTRIIKDSSSSIKDELDNYGFTRIIDGKETKVPDTMAVRYSNSVNSVIYFALLPFGLNDNAVRKSYLGDVKLEGEDYHKVKVTFAEEGGGEDHEDIYIYWISKDGYNVDYLAYEFFIDGGGQRFRKAVNPRVVNGIRFVDYLNFKPKSLGSPIEKIDSLYTNDQLEKVSEINLECVQVEYNDK